MKIPLWFENDRYLNELSDYSEENIFIGDYTSNYSINQINKKNKNNKIYNEKFENESKLSSSQKENKKIGEKFEKTKKINKIKESIFEINMENNLIDFNIFKELLDKLNNYSSNKNKNISFNINKEDFDNIDIEDKCYRFSSQDTEEYFDIDKSNDILRKQSFSLNQKSVKTHIHIKNNIFNSIFEK